MPLHTYAPHSDMNIKDSYGVNSKPKGDGALDIHDDDIIVYLQVVEILIRLAPKQWDCVVHGVKWFKWEGSYFLWVWANGQIQFVLHPKQCEKLLKHVPEELGHFGV